MTAAAKIKASSPEEHRKNLIRLLNANSHRHHLWDVFADFCEMGALAFSNSVDLAQYEEREKRYLSIVKKYEPSEVQRFSQMLAELTMAMEYGPDDVLGKVFGELDLGNSARGQFFTPYEVCTLMARQLVGDGADLRATIEDRGFIRVSEPACGAGAMVIAMADVLHADGINYQQSLHVCAQDIDSRAVHMAYLQFSLLNIPAVIILGNTLMMEERECWYTPAHLLGLWNVKLHRGYSLGSRIGLSQEAPEAAPVEKCPLPVTSRVGNSQPCPGEQFALF